jgi:crossover junction endodeoxyribonuclease RuvC
MSRYVGIDPDRHGAIAVLPDGIVLDTPTLKVGKREEYSPAEMRMLLFPYVGPSTIAIVEKPQPLPAKMGGGIANFSRGEGKGTWIGLLAGLGIAYELVTPQRWKAAMLADMGKDKDASRVRAMQLFPHLADLLALKKHHGRAEALLLAEYRRRLG